MADKKDNDFLDAGCEPGAVFLDTVKEADIPYLVLFADVDMDDKDALKGREEEWEVLFGGDK